MEKRNRSVSKVTIDQFITSFRKRSRYLLGDENVEEAGHIKIDTRRGAVLTNTKVVDALYERMTKQKQDIEATKSAEGASSTEKRAFGLV